MWYLLCPGHTGTAIITAAAAQTVIGDAAAAAAQIHEASLWIKATT